MKRNKIYLISIILIAVAFGQTLNAQTGMEEMELYQSVFGMQKKAVVAEFLKVKTDDPFWAIYDEYEAQRKELGNQRLELLNKYAENYESMGNDQYDTLIEKMIELRKGNDKLIDTYYKKIKKATGSKVAAQFFQIEAYFISVIRLTIMEEIPYIGEFDK